VISDHHWTDYIELIDGDLPPKKDIWALCLLCWGTESVGSYRYSNDPIELPDGSVTTFEDWMREVAKTRVMNRPRRLRFFCSNCHVNSDHVAEKK
jgi:hypothetical protein